MPELSEEYEKQIAEFMANMADLMQRKTDKCIHCGTQIKEIVPFGRSVYALPCGCRLWQGTVPDAWKASK